MAEDTVIPEGKEGGPDSERREEERRKSDRRAVNLHHGSVKEIHDGGFVFREHETAQEAFIVKSGTVEIFKTFQEEGQQPRDVVLGELGEGSMFGEMALIDDQPRMASARAVDGPAVVYVISRRQFNTKLDDANLFIVKLLSILAENVRSSSEKVK